MTQKENVYRDADAKTERLGIAHEYKEEGMDSSKREKRWDSERKVITAPRNVVSYSPKKGHYSTTIGHTIGKYPEWMEQGDEDRKREEQRERERIKEILKAHDNRPFKSTHFGREPFDDFKKSFGADEKAKEMIEKSLLSKETGKLPSIQKAKHDKPFRPSHPSRFGKLYGPLNKFPEHMEDPIYYPKRQKSVDSVDKKQAFR